MPWSPPEVSEAWSPPEVSESGWSPPEVSAGDVSNQATPEAIQQGLAGVAKAANLGDTATRILNVGGATSELMQQEEKASKLATIKKEAESKSDYSPAWLAKTLDFLGNQGAEVVGNLADPINMLNKSVNAVAGKPIVGEYKGVNFEGALQDPIKMVEELTPGMPRGTLTGPDNPVTGVAKGLEEIGSGFTTGPMLASLPAFAAGPELSLLKTGGKALMAGQAIKSVPESIQNLQEVVTNPKSTKADIAKAITGVVVGSYIATKMTEAVPGKPKRITGEPNARDITSAESLPQSEIRPSVGQETRVRQPGETPGSQAAGETAKAPEGEVLLTEAKAPEVTAEEVLNKPHGSTSPEAIDAMPDAEFNKLIEGTKDKRYSLTVDATAWAMQQTPTPELIAKLTKLRDAESARNMAAYKEKNFDRRDRSQWYSDALHVLNKDEVGNANAATVTELAKQGTVKIASVNVRLEQEAIGMGAARLGEVAVEGNPDTYGIAQRVREERARAGQVGDVPTGEGINAPDSVEHGRAILAQDSNAADTALKAFEADPKKSVSADGMAVVRAKGEELARAARRTEEKFGTDSPEYNNAWIALTEWDARTKPMQTEWHKIGRAQQGETDIDTGTFTGLQRAHKEATGKDFTPRQAKAAKAKSKKVREAGVASDSATKAFNEQLESDRAGINSAERRALDAASKTVREAAVRLADAETKSRVAQTVADRNAAKIQENIARKALEAAQKRERKAAVDLAKSENSARIREASRKALDDQDKAAQAALDAANETVRKAAARAAEAENKARVAKAGLEKKQAEAERKAAQKVLNESNKELRKAAIAAAKAEVKNRVNPEIKVWEKVKEYLEKGETRFDDIRTKIATDLGMTVEKVTDLITRKPRTKYLADEVWRKQQALRRFQQSAKRWLIDTDTPLYRKAIESVPKILFSLKVGFHGTVALGTHAPMVAFQPRFWKTYVRDFGKMYKMIGKPAYYERQVQDLLRRPNYTVARRAGLVNDPFQYEDFNSPDMTKSFGAITGMGNRGYSVLKIIRQDMFDQMWDKLPKTAQINEVASAIADGLNHATGVVKVSAPKGTAVALFAPRLEMSRVAWLAADPIKAADAFAHWKTASEGEKFFAIQQVKEKAWVAGTMFAMLAINQGVLSAVDSDQKVNFDDPFHSDWLKFKVAGMNLSYGNAMLTMARLPVRLYRIRSSDGGKLKAVIYPDESTYTVLGEYARSQESPFASLATSLWMKGDWQNRPLPNSERPMPKRLRQQGVKPYTWPEFWTEQFLPIPFEEGAREVWKHGLGMSDEQIVHMRKAMATIAIMSATGARLTDDVPYKNTSGVIP